MIGIGGKDRRWLYREDAAEGIGDPWRRVTKPQLQTSRLEPLTKSLVPTAPATSRSRLTLELVPRRSDVFTVLGPDFIKGFASSGLPLRVVARPRPCGRIRTRLPVSDRGSALSCTISVDLFEMQSTNRKALLQHLWTVTATRTGNSLARLGPVSLDLDATGDKVEDTNLAMLALQQEAVRTLGLAGVLATATPSLVLSLTFIQGERPSAIEIASLVFQYWAEAKLTVELNIFG